MNNFDPELINRLKNKIPENDWQMLQTFLNEEKQLDSLRKNLLGQLEHNQNQIDQEWQNINERQRTKLISDIQSNLYDLQLVEHASKKPFLGIAKIIFSANPARCIQRETSPAKSKPPKRRKNELCGLMSSSSDEITSNAKRPTTAREAKIFGANQMQQQEEDRIELDDPAGSSSNFNGQPSRRGGRTKRKTRGPNKNSSHLFSHSPIGEKDEEVEGEEEDQVALNLLLKSPSPPTIECAAPMEVSRPEEHSQTAAETSPQGTKTRKRGRGENAAESAAGIAGGRSPRKRGNERQRNRSGSNGHGDDDCEDEKRTGNADEPTYCFCKQVSFGNMIGCDNKTCPLEWFHFACVGLTSSPKGKWYCPHCRENNKDVKK